MDVLFVYHEVVISSNVSGGRGETKKKRKKFNSKLHLRDRKLAAVTITLLLYNTLFLFSHTYHELFNFVTLPSGNWLILPVCAHDTIHISDQKCYSDHLLQYVTPG